MGFLGAIIIAAMVGGLSVAAVQAAIPDSSGLIHGCYKNSTGMLKVIDSSSFSCASGETSLNWSQNPNNGLPFTCPGCGFTSAAGSRFTGRDLRNAFLPGSIWIGVDLTGTNFGGDLLNNGEMESDNLTNSTLVGANISNELMDSTNFLNADLTNANLTDSNFNNSTNMNTATLTGVTWGSGATCPDGTISGNNGNTCVGHLVP